MFMSKPKFDLDLFWSLPRCRAKLTDGQGAYCALGAGLKAIGLEDSVFASPEDPWGVYRAALKLGIVQDPRYIEVWTTNDGGIFNKNSLPNPEKAKRMLLEVLKDKVEFVSKEVTFKEEEVIAKV